MRYLENSLEKLARILSRQYQVEVIFEGQQAYTDGKKIVLPYFAELTEELEIMLNGYLDHEVAHVKFTTFDEVRFVLNAYHKQLLNVVEDVRIEREMINEYPGTAFHIKTLNDKLLSDIEKNWLSRPWSVRFLISVGMIMDNRKKIEDAEVQKYLDLCQDEISQLNNAKNTKQLRVLTEKMVKKLLQDKKDEEQKNEQKQNGNGENSKDNKDDKKQKGKSGKGQNSKELGDELIESKKDSDFDQYEIDIHRMINNMIEKQIEKEQEELKNVKMNYKYENGQGLVSIPVTTKYDREHNLSGKNKANEYNSLKLKVKPMVNTLKMNLEKIFKSEENCRWKTEKEQGLINSRSLANLASNANYRTIFKDTVRNETDKVAVSILIDLSGSMSGEKVETAKMSAIALGEALNGLGINFEVLGFNTGYSQQLQSYVSSIGDLSRFNRTSETLEHFIFKDFGSNSLVGLSNIKADGANADGESVMWASKRLANRSEKRKVLIVMSDGMPSCGGNSYILQSDLRTKLKQIEKFGIETVGIGIQTDAVKHFYKDYLVINNLKELTTTSLKKLESILLKGIKMRR